MMLLLGIFCGQKVKISLQLLAAGTILKLEFSNAFHDHAQLKRLKVNCRLKMNLYMRLKKTDKYTYVTLQTHIYAWEE